MSTMTRKRKILITGILALCMTAPLSYYAYSWVYYYHYATDRKSTDIVFLWQWKLHAEGLRSAYQHDNYGGTTPEETLQMFVAALEQKDAWLASRYYIPEKQDVVYKELQDSILNGNIERYTQHMTASLSGSGVYSTSTELYFVGFADTQFPEVKNFEIRLYLNPTTSLWKIVSP